MHSTSSFKLGYKGMYSGELPDEIIREILLPALRVPNEVFRSREAVSPFSSYSESTSAFLVVCKSWLRVATPLLYSVVVLRSKPQAQALQRALRGNELLGTFIKKLRIEGGLGSPMYHVLRLSPNLVEIWLQMRVWSSDNVSGMCRGLIIANPQRLIIYDDEYSSIMDNAPSRQLMETLRQCISLKWERLETVDLPFHSLDGYRLPVIHTLCNSLVQVKSLRKITLVEPQYDINFLKSLARNPALDTIHIDQAGVESYQPYRLRQARDLVDKLDDRLKKIIRYNYDIGEKVPFDDDNDDTAASRLNPHTFDPSFVALSSVPDAAKIKIWSNIIYFSLLSDRSPSTFKIDYPSGHFCKVLRPNIVLVSKQFYDLAMRHYYHYCTINKYATLSSIAHALSENPALGSFIHSLCATVMVAYPTSTSNTIKFRPIISSAPNLVHLTSRPENNSFLDFKTLTILATTAGSKLQTLTGYSIARPSSPKPSTPLYAFTSLRTLEWNTSGALKFKSKDVPKNALARLESLSCTTTSETFLQLLGHMILPALRTVIFPVAKKMPGVLEFLKLHGKKLESLNVEDARGCWALCPSLSVMHILGRPFFASQPKLSVKKIVLTNLIS
ncbi:hypothetical protein C0991_007356 [Blastosporella zonata]|nr:hypothetical protein C0991_007356 [Blastosporella zonata]